MNGVLLAAMAAERQRLHEILRRAGHQVHATSDHEDALDVVADTRPSLFIVVVDDIQEDITTLKQLAFLKSGWDHEIKVIAVGDYDDAGTADITLLRAPSETDLLQAVESLFRISARSSLAPTSPRSDQQPSEQEPPLHLIEIITNLGVEFAEEYLASSFGDIGRQLDVLESEIFRKDNGSIKRSLHAIHGLALNVEANDVVALCVTWRSAPPGHLLDELPVLITAIRGMLAYARANVTQLIASVRANRASQPT